MRAVVLFADLHRLRNHKLGLFARMGGPFDRCFFILEMYGDDLDPDEVTRQIGAPPTRSHRKGDERPRGSQFYRTGGWLLESGERQLSFEDTGMAAFEDWLESLPAPSPSWSRFIEQFEAQVRLVVYTDQMNAEFKLTPKAAAELSSRGLPLLIDPYLSLDE